MAASSGKKRTSSPSRASRAASQQAKEQRKSAQKQLAAVVLFCVALLFLCLCFIPGGGLWGGLRSGLFGLFGFCSFVIPLLLIYVAVMATLDKAGTKVGAKVTEAVLLIVLIASAIHIFSFSGTVDFGADIADAFNAFRLEGSFTGSGAVGAVFGGLILLATGSGKAAAIAIVLILIFLCVMLMTGMTLIKLFRGVAKPVQKAGEYREEKLEELAQKREREYNVDVDLGPAPVSQSPKKKRSRKKEEEEIAQVVTDPDQPAQASDKDSDKKPVLLDDIINKMKEPEPKLPADGIIPISAEKFGTDKPEENAQNTEEQEPDVEPQKAYVKPPLECLAPPKAARNMKYEDELKANATKLVDTLKSFGVETRIVDICRGPSVTRYEIQPAAGVKISRITNLTDDLALNLAAGGLRIEAPIPNKAAVGIEVPNKNRATVTLREIIDTDQYRSAKSKLFVALGKDIAGNCTYCRSC